MAALAEACGGRVQGLRKDSVVVTLGTGVGGGVVMDGKLFTGPHGVGDRGWPYDYRGVGGELCTCGNRGCWERYASATAIIRDGAQDGRSAAGGRARIARWTAT